ncbi:DUF6078 family protein, partial [Mediterranea massiliensis]|uniref:DUF6078 family protein n=1 Tax=Mediterranea massiliensis TaxID=1841865 RepID=UPI00266DB50A
HYLSIHYKIDVFIVTKSGKNYYASRKGDRLLPPAEQKQVRSVLRSLGAPDENCFDGYTDCFVWE